MTTRNPHVFGSEPAFPAPDAGSDDYGDNNRGAYRGISARLYLIAHAPEHPQSWFKPVLPPCPETIWSDVDGQASKGNHIVNSAELDAWDQEKGKQRFIQWPGAWADAILKAEQS